MTNPPPAGIAKVLVEARRLARARRWADLARLGDGLEPEPGITGAEPEGPGARPPPGPLPPEVDYLLGDALRRVGRNEEAQRLAVRAEAGAERLADRGLLLRSINLLGMIDFETGALDRAATRFDVLLERATEWEDDEFVARASNNLGVIANVRGERELAMTYYQRALAAYHRLGHTRGLAQTSYNLGISYRALGFAEDAEQHYVLSIRYAELSDSEDVLALAETERAWLRAVEGDGQLAETLATRALERHRSMEDPGGSANATRVLARAAVARDDLPLARERLEDALAITDAYTDPLLRAEIQLERGRVLHASGDMDGARTALLEATDTFASLGATHDASAARAVFESLFPDQAPEPPPV